ncbi:MAG TPA: response regulator transcription factor [Nocardioidaceae bacterium]
MNTDGAPIRVLLVEDHQVVAEGLQALLEEYPDLHVVGWAPTVAAAEAAAAQRPVDLALVDFRLPDGSGADAAAAIRSYQPEAAIVILSVEDSDDAMMAAVGAGASGYLLKSAPSDDVVQAIRRAAEGETLIPAQRMMELLTRRRVAMRQEAERARVRDTLTRRELEILHLLAEGLDNHDIAERLCIEYTTVRSHVHRLLQKLGARSKLEAVVRATELGIVPGPTASA